MDDKMKNNYNLYYRTRPDFTISNTRLLKDVTDPEFSKTFPGLSVTLLKDNSVQVCLDLMTMMTAFVREGKSMIPTVTMMARMEEDFGLIIDEE